MDKQYEYLTKLYLRLKGFLVSNLIIHSEKKGDSDAEIDIVGIRMPFHLQEDRQVNVDDNLECSNDRIEIIIADVKNTSNIKKVKFNEGLRNSLKSIEKLIHWLGCYEDVTSDIIKKFEKYLNLHRVSNWNGFAQFTEDLPIGKFNLKFTFFCPSLPEWEGEGFKYINGTEMLNFIWECLNDKKIIENCSRTYNYEGWNELEKYVRFFKNTENQFKLADFEEYFKNK